LLIWQVFILNPVDYRFRINALPEVEVQVFYQKVNMVASGHSLGGFVGLGHFQVFSEDRR
jgi:hypothetical protein